MAQTNFLEERRTAYMISPIFPSPLVGEGSRERGQILDSREDRVK